MKTRAEVVTRMRLLAARFGGAEEPGLPLGELLPILYPGLEGSSGLLVEAQALLGGRIRVQSLADIRRILGFFDRQVAPSPVQVRLPRSEVRWHAEDGLQFALDPDDGSIAPAVLHGQFERHVTAVMERVCRPSWNVLDIGANIGYHTMRLASLVGASGSVLAIEANPANCMLIEASVERNGFTNVRLLPVGLGQEDGWSWFTGAVGSNGTLLVDSSPTKLLDLAVMVPLLRLDRLVVTESVDFIKIDVEGAENRVFEGGKETITRHRPVIVSEFSCEMTRRVSGIEPRNYLGFFAGLGYRIYVIDRDSPGHLVPYSSPDDLLKSWPGDLHVEDLLFLPEEKVLTDG